MAETEISKQRRQPKAEEKYEERLVRILSKDIEGKLGLYVGLTKIKGISWSVANAICKVLKLDKKKKIGTLSKEEIEQINSFAKSPTIPKYLLNRKMDVETGEDKHLIGNDLDLQKEFDIGRLRKIKSYRGIRHTAGLPVRGQSTKAHFRKNKKKGVGIKKKNKTEGTNTK